MMTWHSQGVRLDGDCETANVAASISCGEDRVHWIRKFDRGCHHDVIESGSLTLSVVVKTIRVDVLLTRRGTLLPVSCNTTLSPCLRPYQRFANSFLIRLSCLRCSLRKDRIVMVLKPRFCWGSYPMCRSVCHQWGAATAK